MSNEIVRYSDTALEYIDKAGGRITFFFILLLLTLVFILAKCFVNLHYDRREADTRKKCEEERKKLRLNDKSNTDIKEIDEKEERIIKSYENSRAESNHIFKYINIGLLVVDIIVCIWVIISFATIKANMSFTKVNVSLYYGSRAEVDGAKIPGYYVISYKSAPEKVTLAVFIKNTGKTKYNELIITEENGQVKEIVENLAPR